MANEKNEKLDEDCNAYYNLYCRKIAKEVYVKKNVTIPQWLDILAKERKINYSAALVKGIKMELGINH